jgi:PAS domain S-box-containing protein
VTPPENKLSPPPRSEAVLRAFCDASMEAIVLHENGVILSANPTAEAVFGYGPGEMTGMRVTELSAPQSLEMAQRAVATRRSETYDGYARRKDGTPFRTEVRGRNVDCGEGSVRATVLRAVTDEDEFERERLASVSLLRTTVESTADGILVVDRSGRLVLHNKRFWSMWSIPPELMESALDEQLLVFVERQLVNPAAFRSRIDALYDSPDLESTDELELVDGRIFERYSRPQFAGDRVIGRVWSFRDVTAQRRAERDLDRSIKMRDEFISIASHELFTPITSLVVAIRGLTQLAVPAGADARTRLLAVAERQINRLSRQVRELLDVTRIDLGRLSLNCEDVDLVDLVRETVERLTPELERDEIRVDVVANESVRGMWDRSRLEQVITNLVTNAMKFGRGRPIVITVEGTPQEATIAVADQGIGIDAERQALIFERFQRAVSGGPGMQVAGLGLGLYICRQIVEAHGGRLGVTSTLGVGSTFRLALPRERPRH